MKFIEKLDYFFKKASEKYAAFKFKLMNPQFVVAKRQKRAAEIDAIDLSRLSKPVNHTETSGPKKMKDFSNWATWKSVLVGIIGVGTVFLLWYIYGLFADPGTNFLSTPADVFSVFWKLCGNGSLWVHLSASLSRVLVGYSIAIVASIPLAFIMAWYKPVRAFLDPFIQFLRCIPPIAYVPIVVAAMGVGEAPKYFIIFLACFLTMTVTIYQGVKNVDLTLVKAAYTFGARDRNLFLDVIVPSSFPFILTAMRLGVGAALTTLIAAELTGAQNGLGNFINGSASQLMFDRAIMGILILGFFGILLDKILLYCEKRLTRWK